MVRDIKSNFTGDQKTNLDLVITGIPWGKGFDYGMGVDAISGSLTGSAIQPFTPYNRTEKSSSEHYRFVQSQSDLNMEVEVSASGKYNIEGVNVSASAAYLHKIKFSELSITLIAQYESQHSGYDKADSYELTDQAKKLMSDPSAFRNSYGDYFIAGGLRTSRFTALYSCQSSSTESMDSFKASFAGEAPNVFSAEGSVSFMQTASKNNIRIAVDLLFEGYEGEAPSGPWTPETILQALTWFKGAEKGHHFEAMLVHYGTIDPSYPRMIDIAPSAFVDLHVLYTTLWDVRSRYASCPKYYQEQLRKDYITLDTGVTAQQSILAIEADRRLEYQRLADTLLSRLNDVFARMDFYTKVQNAVETEPANGSEIEEGTGQQSWMYGYSAYTKSAAVVISSTTMNYAEGWQIGWRERTLEFGPNDQYLIVGWQVISNWNDGTNGSWWKAVDHILLTHYAAAHVKSRYDKGCDWGFRVYYVEAKDYQF